MSKGKLLAASIVWLILIGLLAALWRGIYLPRQRAARERERAEQQQMMIEETSSSSLFDHRIKLGLDSFSGYAIFRARQFHQQLEAERIEVTLVDDKADYARRLRDLQQGELHLAVFPIDALIRAAAELGDIPATIIAVIDETHGADAIVGYRKSVPTIDSLNHPEVRFVLTPLSPSETLARVVISQFALHHLPKNPFVHAQDAADVYRRYQAAKPDTREVFVLWEPYVSKILENPDTHAVLTSARLRGYIVDCLVTGRDYLVKNRDTVERFVGAYFRTLHEERDRLVHRIYADAQATGTPVTDQQAERLVAGIRWRNAKENLVHFGLLSLNSLQHLEKMIDNITDVLLATGAINADPTGGQASRLFDDKVLTHLQDGALASLIEQQTIREDVLELPPLSDEQWSNLRPIGTLRVADLVFARGRAELTPVSHAMLDELVDILKTWPEYYVEIRGNASARGTLSQNLQLARSRAEATAKYLRDHGISATRLRATAREPDKRIDDFSVSFVLGQP